MSTLVLKKWRLSQVTTTTEAMHIEIVGRKSGIISWLLTLSGVDPTTSLLASEEGITFKSTSFAGADLRFIPFESLSSVSWEIYKPWKNALVIFFLVAMFGTVILALLISFVTHSTSNSPIPITLGFLIGTALAIASALMYFKLNRQLAIGFIEVAGMQHRIRFKRSFIENVNVNQQQAEEAYKIIRWLMTSSRAQHTRDEPQHVPVTKGLGFQDTTQGFSPSRYQNSDSTPTRATPATPSIEVQEALAVELYEEAKIQLANGAKNSAIELLRKIIRMYPNTGVAEKARVSLKNR